MCMKILNKPTCQSYDALYSLYIYIFINMYNVSVKEERNIENNEMVWVG